VSFVWFLCAIIEGENYQLERVRYFVGFITMLSFKTRAVLIGLVFFVYPLLLSAQEGIGAGQDIINLRPSMVEEVVEPGDVERHIITVTNRSGRTETFYPAVQDMRGISDQGAPLFVQEGQGDFGLSDWIKISPDLYELAPGESGQFELTVTVPTEAGPGGYYGAFFVTRFAPEQRQTGAAVDVRVGSILNFRVQGDAHEEAVIREFFSDKSLYQTGEDVAFTLRVENRGNVLARPRGAVTIVNAFGDVVDQVAVNHPRPGGVFPGAVRNFTFSWKPEGVYFGRFHAELDLAYGETGVRTISDRVSFWILPLNLIIGLSIGLLVLVLIIFGLVRLYIKRQIRLATAGRKVSVQDTVAIQSSPLSKLTIMVVAALLFTILFAVVVLVMFA